MRAVWLARRSVAMRWARFCARVRRRWGIITVRSPQSGAGRMADATANPDNP